MSLITMSQKELNRLEAIQKIRARQLASVHYRDIDSR